MLETECLERHILFSFFEHYAELQLNGKTIVFTRCLICKNSGHTDVYTHRDEDIKRLGMQGHLTSKKQVHKFTVNQIMEMYNSKTQKIFFTLMGLLKNQQMPQCRLLTKDYHFHMSYLMNTDG
ncbi:Hypothetical_protein [Hexamita inflata]|uniref:Hypothetical_protein n=1 Tax=Hexamita inflata TaxID=28002 RepID=A0AA86RLP7_9EUKA|nr:Hypothetical protein HINF_LOCUS61837 [Hexamita inflata]